MGSEGGTHPSALLSGAKRIRCGGAEIEGRWVPLPGVTRSRSKAAWNGSQTASAWFRSAQRCPRRLEGAILFTLC